MSDDQLELLAQTMMEWSDSATDHHMLAAIAIRELIEKRREIDALLAMIDRLKAEQQRGEAAEIKRQDGMVLVPVELIQFLNGSGEIDGMSFGEYLAPSEGDYSRKFWWRKHLPSVPDGTITAAKEQDNDIL